MQSVHQNVQNKDSNRTLTWCITVKFQNARNREVLKTSGGRRRLCTKEKNHNGIGFLKGSIGRLKLAEKCLYIVEGKWLWFWSCFPRQVVNQLWRMKKKIRIILKILHSIEIFLSLCSTTLKKYNKKEKLMRYRK